MSEHQCYDFVALARPLTAKEMAERHGRRRGFFDRWKRAGEGPGLGS